MKIKHTHFQEELLKLIQKEIPLHSVYVIGIQSEKQTRKTYLKPKSKTKSSKASYTLLIIGYKPLKKGLGDLMDDLYGKMGQRCRVYIIYYTLSNVKRAMNIGDNFLSRTIHKTPCLYREDDTLIKVGGSAPFCHKSVYEDIQRTWESRMERAGYLLNILDGIEPNENALSRLSTMHHALEQVCMGLLYLFWEFRPQHYTLPYMLHLCGHFTDLPRIVFPTETYGLHRVHYMLCNAHHIIRFRNRNEFTDVDADKAYRRCEQFYSAARELGDRHLEHLRKLHCKQETVHA